MVDDPLESVPHLPNMGRLRRDSAVNLHAIFTSRSALFFLKSYKTFFFALPPSSIVGVQRIEKNELTNSRRTHNQSHPFCTSFPKTLTSIMGWPFRNKFANSKTPNNVAVDEADEEEKSIDRPHPQIIEADGEEGAELIFAEPFSTPTKRGGDIEATTPKTLLEDNEVRDNNQDTEEQSVRTDSRESLTKEGFHTTKMTNVTTRRLSSLTCVLLVLLAIILGIVFGTQNARESPEQAADSAVTDEEEEETTPPNAITNDKCSMASKLIPDGSLEVGVISSSSQSSFSNGGGSCGDATYAGQSLGKWYYTPGTGDFLNVSACEINCTAPANALAIPEVTVFTGECDDLYCIDGVSNLLESGPLQFQAIRGQNYYIYIQGGQETLGLVEIFLTEV